MRHAPLVAGDQRGGNLVPVPTSPWRDDKCLPRWLAEWVRRVADGEVLPRLLPDIFCSRFSSAGEGDDDDEDGVDLPSLSATPLRVSAVEVALLHHIPGVLADADAPVVIPPPPTGLMARQGCWPWWLVGGTATARQLTQGMDITNCRRWRALCTFAERGRGTSYV